jgi:hypothetical protein
VSYRPCSPAFYCNSRWLSSAICDAGVVVWRGWGGVHFRGSEGTKAFFNKKFLSGSICSCSIQKLLHPFLTLLLLPYNLLPTSVVLLATARQITGPHPFNVWAAPGGQWPTPVCKWLALHLQFAICFVCFLCLLACLLAWVRVEGCQGLWDSCTVHGWHLGGSGQPLRVSGLLWFGGVKGWGFEYQGCSDQFIAVG